MRRRQSAGNESGFILAGMIALLASAVLLAAGYMIAHENRQTLGEATGTQTDLSKIEDALYLYYMQTGAFPCPDAGTGYAAANCTAPAYGAVPYKSLSLRERDTKDGWGRPISYAVDPAVTIAGADEGALSVLDETDDDLCDAVCAFVLVSHGQNGLGTLGYTDPTAAYEIENTDSNDDPYLWNVFREAPISHNAPVFDDRLLFGFIPAEGENGGSIPTEPIVGTIDETTADPDDFTFDQTDDRSEVITENGEIILELNERQDGEGNSALQNQQSCLWLNQPFSFANDETLRIFFNFEWGQRDGATQTQGNGDGATITLLSSDTMPSTNLCNNEDIDALYSTGSPEGSDLAYVGWEGERVAVEIDTYRSTIFSRYTPLPSALASRTWLDPARNHVAVLMEDYTHHDYNGESGLQNRNPACDEPPTYFNNNPNFETDFEGCTTTRRNNDRNWLEDGNDHVLRLEVTRGCNSTCGDCSGGGDYMRFLGWVDCDMNDLNADNDPRCADVTTDYVDNLGKPEPTRYMLNHCGQLSAEEKAALDAVRVGFTLATGSAYNSLTIHDFKVSNEP